MSNHKRKSPPTLYLSQCQKKQIRPPSSPLPSLLPQELDQRPSSFSLLDTVAGKEPVPVPMECQFQGHACEDTNPFSSTPSPPPLPSSPSPQRNTKDYDQCFICRRFGHWAVDCPNKTPKKSQPSSPGSPSSSSTHLLDLPVVRCPCGRGTCKVFTSNTLTNPGRKFYTCPVDHRTSVKCKFFKWGDQIVGRFKPPMCPCGAGTCSLNMVSSGPDRDRWYYACRIKKSHGACQFFQWADSEVGNSLNMHVDESKGNTASPSLFTGHQVLSENNDLCKEDNQISDTELESAVVESFENSPNSSMASPSRKDEIPVRDLVTQDSKSLDLVAGTVVQDPPVIPNSEIPCQESVFALQISAAAAGRTTSTSSFDAVIEDVGDIEGLNPLADSSSNDDETDIPQGSLLQSPREGAEHPNSVFQESSGIKIVAEKNDISKSALKTFGQGLLDILQSMDQTQHETMLKVAEATFDTLRHLSIDNASFSKAVREYIHCKSTLAGMEESIGKDFSSEEFLGLYNDKKTQFDNVSHLHVEASSAYEASEKHLQSLRGEVSHVKDVLLQLEKQLSIWEAKTMDSKSRVAEISKDRSESERDLDAACEKMEEALKLEHERDSMVDAANSALENARFQLLQ